MLYKFQELPQWLNNSFEISGINDYHKAIIGTLFYIIKNFIFCYYILLKQAFDINVGHAFRSTIAVVVSILIAFIMSWVVALVVLPAFPLMILGGYIQLVLTKRYTDQRNGLIEDSAKVAIEAIENVYTVATLGIETRLARKYDDLLELPFK